MADARTGATSVRTRKRRTAARVLAGARFLADLRAEMAEWGDDQEPPDDLCLHCGGDGMDPDCDYLMPCPDCG